MINRQTRTRNCGPTAIYNITRLMGHKIPYNDIEQACIGMDYYIPRKGMPYGSFEKCLKSFGVRFRKRYIRGVRDLDKYLDEGRVIILRYCPQVDLGHVVVIDDRTAKTYSAWNVGGKTSTVHRETLKKKIYQTNRFGENWCYGLIL